MFLYVNYIWFDNRYICRGYGSIVLETSKLVK